MLIKIQGFQGEIPGLSKRLLPQMAAQLAQNCKLWRGELQAFYGLSTAGTPIKAGVIETVYRFADAFWFHWPDDVNAARGPIASDTSERTFYTISDDGLTKPQKTDNSIGPAGSEFGSQPVTSYNMGVAPPAGAATVALGAGGGCAAEEKVTKAWAYSFVSVWGEEGAMSPVSASLDVCPGQTVNLSGMDVSAGAGYNVTQQRIYRINTGSSGAAYQLVATQNVATTYADSIPDESLGAVAINEDYDEPPDDMEGLLILPNGIAAGFSGIDVCLSEPYILHAWPIGYRQPCDYDVVAIGAYDQNIVVGTEGTPYLITGVHPTSMSMIKLDINQACVSKRGMVSLGRMGVMYPSPDGLVLVGPSGTGVVTQGIINKDEWDSYTPSDIDAYAHEGRYYGFSSGKSFIFDPKAADKGFITLSGFNPTAGFRDLKTDLLYLQDGEDDLKVWEGDTSSLLTYQWKSKEFVVHPLCMQAAQVKAASYEDLRFNMYVDGRLRHSAPVFNNKPFRMKGGYKGRVLVFELVGTDTVYDLEVAGSVSELSAG